MATQLPHRPSQGAEGWLQKPERSWGQQPRVVQPPKNPREPEAGHTPPSPQGFPPELVSPALLMTPALPSVPRAVPQGLQQAGTPPQLPGLGVGSGAVFSIFPNPKSFQFKNSRRDLTVSILGPSPGASADALSAQSSFCSGSGARRDAAGNLHRGPRGVVFKAGLTDVSDHSTGVNYRICPPLLLNLSALVCYRETLKISYWMPRGLQRKKNKQKKKNRCLNLKGS